MRRNSGRLNNDKKINQEGKSDTAALAAAWRFDVISMEQIIAQIIGIAAAALAVLSFQFKSNTRMFAMQLVASALFVVNFALLGGIMGAMMNVIGIIRNAMLCINKKWSHHWVVLVTLIAMVLAAAYFWGDVSLQNWYSILPVVAMIVSSILMWTNDGKVIRIGQLICTSPCWLTYNIAVFSLGGIITETFNIISIFISFARFGLKGFEKKTK